MQDPDCAARYVARYVDGFGAEALSGLRIGVYEHSSVARDTLGEIVEGLGAEAVRLARSDSFIPVDTAAVDPDTRAALAGWADEHALDAIISTDGDADRPMVADAQGAMIPGDVLGPLTARLLGARIVVTPVSSNTSRLPPTCHVSCASKKPPTSASFPLPGSMPRRTTSKPVRSPC